MADSGGRFGPILKLSITSPITQLTSSLGLAGPQMNEPSIAAFPSAVAEKFNLKAPFRTARNADHDGGGQTDQRQVSSPPPTLLPPVPTVM